MKFWPSLIFFFFECTYICFTQKFSLWSTDCSFFLWMYLVLITSSGLFFWQFYTLFAPVESTVFKLKLFPSVRGKPSRVIASTEVSHQTWSSENVLWNIKRKITVLKNNTCTWLKFELPLLIWKKKFYHTNIMLIKSNVHVVTYKKLKILCYIK